MQKLLRNKKVIALFVIPGASIYGIFFLFPLVQSLFYSLFEWNGIATVPMKFAGIENYIRIFLKDSLFYKSLTNSLFLVVMLLLLQIPLALLLAVLVSRRKKGSRVFKTIYFMPMVISTVAIALLWSKVFEPNYGIVNQILNMFTQKKVQTAWLSDKDTIMWMICIPIALQGIGFHFIVLYAGVKGVPEQYYEAAILDGASKWEAEWHITIPLLRDIIKICIIMAVLGALKMFDFIYVLTGGGPINSSLTLAIHMYNQAFEQSQFGYGSALAVVLLIECLVVYLLLNKLLTKEAVEY